MFRWFNNLKIRKKLIGAFLAVIGLTILVSVLALISQNSAQAGGHGPLPGTPSAMATRAVPRRMSLRFGRGTVKVGSSRPRGTQLRDTKLGGIKELLAPVGEGQSALVGGDGLVQGNIGGLEAGHDVLEEVEGRLEVKVGHGLVGGC